MSSSFEAAMAAHPAPRRLGDIALRYEPSMLIGETPKPPRGIAPTLAWLGGIASLLVALGLLVLGASVFAVASVAALGAVGLSAAVVLERIDRRQRRFVANFGTTSLRLDFVTPFAGRPRTLVVSFDAVRAVDLSQQAPKFWCLTVDFVERGEVLREVLAAFISKAELEQAERLTRVLHGAFGLGEVPPDSPAA